MEQNTTEADVVSTSRKEKFPLEIIIILILLSVSFIGILSSIIKPIGQFGTFILMGLPEALLSFVVAAVLAVSFYGIFKRKMWARTLTIVLCTVSMGLATLNFISFLVDKQSGVLFYQLMSPGDKQLFQGGDSPIMGYLISSLIIGVITSLPVIFYAYRKRDFFKN